MNRRLCAVGVVIGALGCVRGSIPEAVFDPVAIQHSVDSATRAFAQAQRDLDADRVISSLAPDFYMYVDGSRLTRDSVVASIRQSFATLNSLETEFQNVEVTVLGPDGAVASFTFRDRTTNSTGDTHSSRGPTTLVWVRSNRGWVIAYADADHYDVTPH